MLERKKGNSVSIVIPVYKDWETLSLCLESLKKYVSDNHQVLVVSDNSDEADFLEEKILEAIKGKENFKYFRNEVNLGFVKNCNHAVFDLDKTNNDILLLNSDTEVTEGFLDEMIAVMDISEKHGIVCARSNNATILSVPFFYNENRLDILRKSYDYYNKIKPLLPRYSIIPTGVGFCMLINRNLIKNFGLFDEIYGKGYNEENDFCCRVNRYGYSAVAANHSFVFHYETRSFTLEQKISQNNKNEKILFSRYPEYFPAVRKYFDTEISPVDYFSDLICHVHPKKSLLFCLYNLPNLFNGTSEYQISLVKSFCNLFKDKYDITILASRSGGAFHNLNNSFEKVIYCEDLAEGNERFDLAMVPAQFFNIEIMSLLNKHALKIVFSPFDAIAWRSNYLNTDSKDFILYYSIMFSDGLISISDFTKDDVFNYLEGKANKKIIKPLVKTIYPGITECAINEIAINDELKKIGLNKNDFILVIGNKFFHKSLQKVVETLLTIDEKRKVVFLGITRDELDNKTTIGKNFVFIKSGFLTENMMNSLYASCSFIIFPSQYEGFGLPIAKAIMKNKKVIAFNNQINRELLGCIPEAANNVLFFDYFSDLESLINKISENLGAHQDKSVIRLRSWDEVAKETQIFIEEVISEEVNLERLESRWKTLNYFQSIANDARKLSSIPMIGKMNVASSIEWSERIKFAIFNPERFIKKYYGIYKYRLLNFLGIYR